MQVWNVLLAAHWKYRMQNDVKIAICTPSHNFVGLYLRNQGMYQQPEKKLVKPQYVLHMPSQYRDLRHTNCWDLLASLGHPSNFHGFRILPLLLQQRRSLEANQTLHDIWPSPGLVHYIYIFGGSCSLTEFCPVQNSLYVQVLHLPILAALLHGTPAASISQTLRCHTRNGITELSQRAPPIFGRAAITLCISPHSSLNEFYVFVVKATYSVQVKRCNFRVSYFPR